MGQPGTGAQLIGPQYGFHFYVPRAIALIATVFPGLYAIVKAEIRASAINVEFFLAGTWTHIPTAVCD